MSVSRVCVYILRDKYICHKRCGFYAHVGWDSLPHMDNIALAAFTRILFACCPFISQVPKEGEGMHMHHETVGTRKHKIFDILFKSTIFLK